MTDLPQTPAAREAGAGKASRISRFRIQLARARIDIAADAQLTDVELAELARVFT